MTDLSSSFDARTILARPDLAAQALEGLVRADKFQPVEPMRGVAAVADIHAAASPDSERIDQLLKGELFDVLDRRGGRVWGQARRDGIVGWMDAAALEPHRGLPDRRVAATRADLPLNALIDPAAPASPDHAPIGDFESDPVVVAERLLGVPHSLGARSSVATDCSGLVQQALYACGLPGPRQAHEQAGLGRPVARSAVQRGDIVVWLAPPGTRSWTGHSALMLDDTHVIHATGHHGAVVTEALSEADARCLAEGFAPAVFRRLA
ncbi:MAG: NlpC/P60 family protein [Brevundimonas sp.]|uniref:C40 family peptidase n=1 Tax=Brevundimonas sp. TaxID=1871086 RepID=UPI002736AD7D|nr:NlpC/P60 family protein [Brevundimonas sp.]MDP3406043.1 NlpC/P60 family protein [Brevundimonas sp.]